MKISLIFIAITLPLVLTAQSDKILQARVDTFMNAWHHAAAVADEDVFFGSMHSEGLYIGTDATEYWTRDEMAEWAAPFFERDTAWAFTTISRNAYLHDSGDLIWFDELLDTWMGTCRASGVITLSSDGQMLIRHYHLSIAVPNESVKSYLEIIGLPAKD